VAIGKVQGITYLWDRIIVGFLHTSFNGFFTTVLVAGGVGVQYEEAGSSGTAMSVAPIAGGGAVSVEGVSCPDIVPATVIVTSSATEGDGSALSTSMGLASGASFLLGGTSATLWRWELGKEDEGLQDRVVIGIQQNNSTLYSLTDTYSARSVVLALRFRISRRRRGTRGASSDHSTDDPEESSACTLSPVAWLPAADSLPTICSFCALAAALGGVW
jgi:hypothetical protein